MNIFNTIIGIPLGYAIYFSYRLTNSYGIAILIFAVIARAVLFPVSAFAHKNSIRLLQIQPSLNIIKVRYAGDKERLNEEQYNLFKRERYSPFLGIIPLFVQLVLLIGVLQVMYHPLQHMLHLNSDIINVMLSTARELFNVQGGATEQLRVIDAIQIPANLPAFRAALAGFPETDSILQSVQNTDLSFIGFNLGETPSFTRFFPTMVVPFISGISALAFCLVSNAISPGALSQSKATGYGLTAFTVVLSLYFALASPIGVGIYWTMGNILSIFATLILCKLYNPKKLAGEALAQIVAARMTHAQLREKRKRKKVLSEREKADAARFRSSKKHLIFYALTSGQYKFYKDIIEYILEHSDIVIHYLTNDPDDAIFRQENDRLIPYYASQQKTIALMLRLDTDILATTVPDLQSYHIKRSVVRDDIEYIYVFHTITSTQLTLKEKALDHFDTLFCVGPHQVNESRRREELAGLPKRNLVKVGYGLYDQLIESYAALDIKKNGKPRILIAPSWQVGNILESCIDDILKELLGKGYSTIVRPHPQFTRLFPERMKMLVERYARYVADSEISFELDFSGNESIFSSDLLITDWSNIAFEFSYCTLKPSIFINTPMKVMNPNYGKYGLEVLDISLRDKVGVSVNVDEISTIDEVVGRMLADKESYREKIEQTVQNYLYYPGRSGEAGGRYIIMKLGEKEK